MTAYWILKTEPSAYGFDQLERERTAVWDGVKNPLALKHLGEMRPGDDLISPEGAFRFFYPGHVEQSYPNGCEFLHRFRVFVLTTDEGSQRYMRDFLHLSPEPSHWAACKFPHLTQLTDGSEGYAVFRIDSS